MTSVVPMRLVLLWAVAVSIAGCSSSAGNREADRTRHSPMATDVVPSTAGPADRQLILGSHGLGPVRFGGSKSRTTAKLTELLGPPSGSGTNPGCGPAFTEVQWGELAVEFHDDVFSGYRDINRPEGNLKLAPVNDAEPVRPNARSAAGIALGDSLGEVRAAYSTLSLKGANRWQASNGLSFVDNASRSPGPARARIVEIRVGTCGSY